MNATTDQLYQALLDGPAMDPPLGVTVDFVDPPNLQRKVIIALTLYTAFATLVILMRLYTKVFLFRKTVFEDCMSRYIDILHDSIILMLHRCRRFRMGKSSGLNCLYIC